MVLGIVAALTVLTTRSADHKATVETCPFERTWYQGDQHYWQELTFQPDGSGKWLTGGMASDAPHKRIKFRWQRDQSTLTAKSGGESRTARFEITQHDWGCYLWFDQRFLPDEQQSTHWTDMR